jgi:hypothetical protein
MRVEYSCGPRKMNFNAGIQHRDAEQHFAVALRAANPGTGFAYKGRTWHNSGNGAE